MNYWDSVGRWINTLLVFIVGILAFDTLFRMLRANDDNVIVGIVRVLALAFLVPFQGMFGEQDYVLTTLFAVLGYALLAGIALGVLRALQASRAQQPPHVAHEIPADTTPEADRQPAPQPAAERRAAGETGGSPGDRREAAPAGTRGAPRPAPAAPAAGDRRRNGTSRTATDRSDRRSRRGDRPRVRDRLVGDRRPDRPNRPDTERSG